MRARPFALLFTTLAAACTPAAAPEPTVVIAGPALTHMGMSAPEPLPPLTPKPPPLALADYFRDPRFSHHPPRSLQLLVVETRAIETLLGNTADSSPDRPKLIRRLAEG